MWTKVSEGVPEIGQEVIVQTDIDTIMVLTYGKYGFNGMREEKNAIECKAWMPVPELMKEEEA